MLAPVVVGSIGTDRRLVAHRARRYWLPRARICGGQPPYRACVCDRRSDTGTKARTRGVAYAQKELIPKFVSQQENQKGTSRCRVAGGKAAGPATAWTRRRRPTQLAWDAEGCAGKWWRQHVARHLGSSRGPAGLTYIATCLGGRCRGAGLKKHQRPGRAGTAAEQRHMLAALLPYCPASAPGAPDLPRLVSAKCFCPSGSCRSSRPVPPEAKARLPSACGRRQASGQHITVMKWANALWLLPAVLRSAYGARDYDAHDYYAVHLSPDILPENLASHLGLDYDGPLGNLADHHAPAKRDVGWDEPHVLDNVLLSQKQELHKRFPLVKRSALPPLEQEEHLWRRQNDRPKVIDSSVQKGLDIAAELEINDPIFQEQWHLYNHVQTGHDINVTGVWSQGITGKNATISIVDDGLDMDSDDLKENYFAKGSYDFNDAVEDPKPRLSDDKHGTRCAGEVSAVRNGVCGVGVAYDSKVAGERILSKVISDADEAVAMNYAFQDNHIYSCSWGPSDNGEAMERPGILIRRAMVNGVQKGRDGLGSIYVFAIGNGAANDDDCNFDGYTNSIYSVSVGGIDRKGLHPYYSEKCSAQLVVTYSSGSGDAIHTTDVGKDACYTNHGGTSAAGPLVAGIYALMLEANPKLNWRDFQYITALTAVKVDQPSDWELNKALGKEFSHQKDNAHSGYVDWEFMSVAHWGEDGVGDWTVVVKDTKVDSNSGTFTDWRLKLWGESIDGDKQELLPLPNEYDDDDHDREDANVGTTSVAVPTVTGQPEGNPTDHIDRPVNIKTSTTATPEPPRQKSHPKRIPPPPRLPALLQDPTSSPTHSPPSAQANTPQIWIYGSAVLIVAFLAGIGGWWYYMRRKRQRWMSRDEYGFEMVEHDDIEDEDGKVGGSRRNKRAGELYDAFAEGSDEETPFDLGSESERDSDDEDAGGHRKEAYRDVDQGGESRYIVKSADCSASLVFGPVGKRTSKDFCLTDIQSPCNGTLRSEYARFDVHWGGRSEPAQETRRRRRHMRARDLTSPHNGRFETLLRHPA
ncbi:hypothetical protein L1887_63278 [Cichorium endivia]|nr:hypothetical protein L1887_63278 [Cichorium endivia]